MSRRDEVVEAAKGASVSPDPYPTLPEMLRDWADIARKADTILKEVPNEVEALEALPVGTVLRGDAREEGVIVAHLTRLGWTEGEVPYDSTRLLFRHADLLGIDSWQVLWMPEDES